MAISIDQKGYIGGVSGLTFERPTSPKIKIIGKILWVLTVILVIVTGSLYFWLNFRLSPQISSIEQEIETLNANQKVLQAQQFVVLQSQLRSLRTILENHIYGSNLLNFLESITHPQVRFESINVDLVTRKISLSSEAASFNVAAEQLKILEANSMVDDFSVSDFKTGQTGSISFGLVINFSGEVIKK